MGWPDDQVTRIEFLARARPAAGLAVVGGKFKMLFRIDEDNNIVALPDGMPADNSLPVFSTEAQLLAAISDRDPVDVWNSFAGTPGFSELKPVKKFETRKIGVARIWKAIQRLAAAPAAKRTGKAAKTAKPKVEKAAAAAAGGETKRELVRRMIGQKGGATLEAIMKETGWQAHSVRGFISTLQSKHGVKVESSRREDGARVYQEA